MAIYTDTLPQMSQPVRLVTIRQLLQVLPETLAYPFNVWISGKIARYGITTDNLIFLIEADQEPTAEIRLYFSGLVEPLGVDGTASHRWKEGPMALRLYNLGRLIVDKNTCVYKELPEPTRSPPILTVDEVRSRLPAEIRFQETLFLTGGLVKNGWSGNDADILIFDEITVERLLEIRRYFTALIGWRTDVGRMVMIEREPVYLFKLYEKGRCLV